MSAIYRAKLNFTWDSLEGAATALDRLRRLAYEWGEPDHRRGPSPTSPPRSTTT